MYFFQKVQHGSSNTVKPYSSQLYNADLLAFFGVDLF